MHKLLDTTGCLMARPFAPRCVAEVEEFDNCWRVRYHDGTWEDCFCEVWGSNPKGIWYAARSLVRLLRSEEVT